LDLTGESLPAAAVAKLCKSMARGAGGKARNRGDQWMNRILLAIVLALSAFVAGCQRTIPPYNFHCTPRAIDAGFCSETSSFHLQERLASGEL